MKRYLSIAAGLLFVFAAAGCSNLPFGMGGGGWTTLVDGGKGIENFNRLGDANWRIVDGALQADRKTDKSPSYLVTKTPYGDFQARVEFWASSDANSGIFMRCQDPKVITDKSCYEANIFDQRPDPTYGTGAIVHIAKVAPMPKAGGKWNTFEITAKGRHITVVLNGQKTAELHNGLFTEGPLTLQHGAGVIKFRKVAVKPL